MSLLDQPVPAKPVKVRMVYGPLAVGRSKDLKRSIINHRYYAKTHDKKAAYNRRRYREMVEKIERLEAEVAQLRARICA